MNDGQVVIGYHGCDITTRDDLVSGRTKPLLSRNSYDWLGAGFYVFEGDHERAEVFAGRAAASPEKRLTRTPHRGTGGGRLHFQRTALPGHDHAERPAGI